MQEYEANVIEGESPCASTEESNLIEADKKAVSFSDDVVRYGGRIPHQNFSMCLMKRMRMQPTPAKACESTSKKNLYSSRGPSFSWSLMRDQKAMIMRQLAFTAYVDVVISFVVTSDLFESCLSSMGNVIF